MTIEQLKQQDSIQIDPGWTVWKNPSGNWCSVVDGSDWEIIQDADLEEWLKEQGYQFSDDSTPCEWNGCKGQATHIVCGADDDGNVEWQEHRCTEHLGTIDNYYFFAHPLES